MGRRCQRSQPRPRCKKENAVTQIGKSLMGWKPLKSRQKVHGTHSRSFAPRDTVAYERALQKQKLNEVDLVGDTNFFDIAVGSSMYCQISPELLPNQKVTDTRRRSSPPSAGMARRKPKVAPTAAPVTSGASSRGFNSVRAEGGRPSMRPPDEVDGEGGEDEPDFLPDWIEDAVENSDRHAVGLSLMSKIFDFGSTDIYTKRKRRPFFTYWITLIQVVIFLVSIITYGVAPVSLGFHEKTDSVLMINLGVEHQCASELGNMWVGPRHEDLIHLGAKYSPCMRRDTNLQVQLDKDKDKERTKACCIQNDGEGCVLTTEDDCSPILATFKEGTVCGQDPSFCDVPDYDWGTDITEWPICEELSNFSTEVTTNNAHMTCDVLGRPCCVGIYGECIIATREFCDFHRGYFHDDLSLCSQVSCMEEICGMFPFLNPDKPDQFYRLFTSLFLHAGIIQLLITVIFQLLLMRDLEKIIGWWRMALLYMAAGVAGSLASAVFIPYYVESGPSGSQFGVLGLLAVLVMRWSLDDMEDKPMMSLLKVLIGFLVLIVLGMLIPQIDNWAHLFGFFFGVMLAIAYKPLDRLRTKSFSRTAQIFCIIIALAVAAGIFVVVVVLFYVATVNNCDGCMYFNCIPFTEDYCKGMEVNITERGNSITECSA